MKGEEKKKGKKKKNKRQGMTRETSLLLKNSGILVVFSRFG